MGNVDPLVRGRNWGERVAVDGPARWCPACHAVRSAEQFDGRYITCAQCRARVKGKRTVSDVVEPVRDGVGNGRSVPERGQRGFECGEGRQVGCLPGERSWEVR